MSADLKPAALMASRSSSWLNRNLEKGLVWQPIIERVPLESCAPRAGRVSRVAAAAADAVARNSRRELDRCLMVGLR
jgi:hypothetical protein